MSSKEQPQPRGRKERFIVIPFSSTCRSASSVDVVQVQANKPTQGGGAGEAASAAPAERKPPHKPESLSLVARLLRGFKNLSHQIFAVHDDEDDDDEEQQQEMVIGLPTDVKHVAHIGWDGSTSTTTSLRSWNRAAPPTTDAASTSTSSALPLPVPPPSQAQESVRQFELAMAAQASAAGTSGTTGGAQRRHRHYS